MGRLIYNLYLNEAGDSDRLIRKLRKSYKLRADLELALFGINYKDFTYIKGSTIKVKNLKKVIAHIRGTGSVRLFKKMLRILCKLNKRILKLRYLIIGKIIRMQHKAGALNGRASARWWRFIIFLYKTYRADHLLYGRFIWLSLSAQQKHTVWVSQIEPFFVK